jgi:hypothetical protein
MEVLNWEEKFQNLHILPPISVAECAWREKHEDGPTEDAWETGCSDIVPSSDIITTRIT